MTGGFLSAIDPRVVEDVRPNFISGAVPIWTREARSWRNFDSVYYKRGKG
jgi:hypothetical protein